MLFHTVLLHYVCPLSTTMIIGLFFSYGWVTCWHIFEHLSNYKSQQDTVNNSMYYNNGLLLGFCTLQWLTVPTFCRNILPPTSGWQLFQVNAADLTQMKNCVGTIRWFMAVLPITATESRKHPLTVTFPRTANFFFLISRWRQSIPSKHRYT